MERIYKPYQAHNLCDSRFDSCASATTLLLHLEENLPNESEWIKIVKISKQEMIYLQNHGICFGENGIIHTTARHRRTYYLTESNKCMQLLNDYQRKISK